MQKLPKWIAVHESVITSKDYVLRNKKTNRCWYVAVSCEGKWEVAVGVLRSGGWKMNDSVGKQIVI